MTCDTVREHLLDYVYDACEDEVAVTVNAHLQNCSDCAAALAAAKGEQGILAEAASVAAPALTLDPHAEPPVAAPVTRPLYKRVWFLAAARIQEVLIRHEKHNGEKYERLDSDAEGRC